jgi:spoIIIJ-associated protein
MEWVEITGRTVEEAKDAALDQLGVDVDDAEFEILEEPTRGLFGKLKGEARVRARIRPTRPRPKTRRTNNNTRRGPKGGAREGNREEKQGNEAKGNKPRSDRPQRGRTNQPKETTAKETPMNADAVDVDLTEHTRIVTEFLDGLVDAFDLEARVEVASIDDETNEVRIEGRELGLLVGQKGYTLNALQELSRTVVHRKVSGNAEGRVRLDVGGYRQRRREALERFARQVAEEVRSSGVQKALEPMGSADRKIVHDAVNECEGVSTISEGDEPRRRVVIVPD